jgi:hypothetical protein
VARPEGDAGHEQVPHGPEPRGPAGEGQQGPRSAAQGGTQGDRLYNTFVSRLDKDQREEFEETYRALAVITECNDFLVNTAWAYREGKADWIAEAERIRAGHGTA